MRDEPKPDERDELVEDLDVPPEEGDHVVGGQAKTSPSLSQACATGQHIKEVGIHV